MRWSGPVLALLLMAAAPPPAPATWVTLGTGGGPVVRVKRAQPANALVVGDRVYLFDVGDGVLRQMAAAGIAPRQLRAVFLSHHHIDHDAGLGPLLATRWVLGGRTPLPVIGPPGTGQMAAGLAAAYRPVEVASASLGAGPATPLAASIAARDLPDAAAAPVPVFADDKVKVWAVAVDHFHGPAAAKTRSYAYRVEAGGRSFVYSGDTGPSKALETMAAGADVLVTEVMDLAAVEQALRRAPEVPAAAIPSMLTHMVQDHLTPPQVGAMARRARVGQVVLTHLVPGLDDEADGRGYTAGLAAEYSGKVTVAKDLDRF